MSKLIIMEGLDGSGKSTQTRLLEEYFASNDIKYKKIDFVAHKANFDFLTIKFFGKNVFFFICYML